MKPADKIKELINESDVRTTSEADKRILGDAMEHLERLKQKKSAGDQLNLWRIIMKTGITKLAAAAVVIVVVVIICINQFSSSATSLAWGEVAKKVQASRGVIYRERTFNSDTPDDGGCIMFYVSPTRSRMDTYKAGNITRTLYCDYDARNILCVDHNDKICANIPMEERDTQDHQREMSLKHWVREVLSREHKKLGRKAIDGLICEGIETIYPIFGDYNSPIENCIVRVWISVETGYPALFEGGHVDREDGELQIKAVLDRFKWDIELDPSEFEPKIPPDYEKID